MVEIRKWVFALQHVQITFYQTSRVLRKDTRYPPARSRCQALRYENDILRASDRFLVNEAREPFLDSSVQ